MGRRIALAALSAAATAFVAWVLFWPIREGDFYTGVHMPDREIGWVLRPSLRGMPLHNLSPRDLVFSDDHGARVSDPMTPHPIPPVGLLAVGDSQTFGAGVSSSETFTNVAGKLAGLTTVNYGVSGYSGVTSLLLLRRHSDDRPRFVVYGFWFDHLARNLQACLESPAPFCIGRPAVRLTEGASHIVFSFRPATWLPARWPLADRLLVHLAVLRGTFRQTFSPTDQRIAAEYVLHEMQATVQKLGARLIVVWIPSYFGRDIPAMPSWLSALARSADFTLVDVGPGLARLRARGQDLALSNGPFAGHLTVAAHREIGGEIARAISARVRGRPLPDPRGRAASSQPLGPSGAVSDSPARRAR